LYFIFVDDMVLRACMKFFDGGYAGFIENP